MPTTTYGDISQRTAAHAAIDQIEHARPIIVLGKFGMTRPMPKNKAATIKYRRPVPFAVSTTALTEGVTPTSRKMAYEDVTATMDQYGIVTEITDKVEDLSEDPVLKNANELVGENMAEVREMVLYGKLKAGTNVFYNNGSARTAVNTAITLAKTRAVTRALKAQRTKTVTKMLSGSAMYNTTPIEGGYIAFAHTDCEADIRDLAGFIPVAKYGSRQPLCPEECGSVENVRYILSPLLESWADAGGAKGSMYSTTGTSADVYPILFIGKDSFFQIPLKGAEAIKPMVLNPSRPSKSDPLGQVGYVSAKTWFTAAITNQSWMARLEVAITAL